MPSKPRIHHRFTAVARITMRYPFGQGGDEELGQIWGVIIYSCEKGDKPKTHTIYPYSVKMKNR